MVGFGFVNKWTDLIGMRIALGVLEVSLSIILNTFES
jgi:hypothetical protein